MSCEIWKFTSNFKMQIQTSPQVRRTILQFTVLHKLKFQIQQSFHKFNTKCYVTMSQQINTHFQNFKSSTFIFQKLSTNCPYLKLSTIAPKICLQHVCWAYRIKTKKIQYHPKSIGVINQSNSSVKSKTKMRKIFFAHRDFRQKKFSTIPNALCNQNISSAKSKIKMRIKMFC